MQIEELFDLTSWIEKQIVDKQVQKTYTDLHNILSHNALPNTSKQSFETQKEVLIKLLQGVQLSLLSTGQLEVLTEIGIAPLVGDEGVSLLEELLFRNVLDIATTVTKVGSNIDVISSSTEWSRVTRAQLQRIINVDEVRDQDDEAILRVHFQKEAHLSNVTEFKEWGKNWYEIGRGIAMAHGAAPEDLKVIGASKGSVILTLATSYAIAKTASFIILEALKVIEKVYDIRKTAEEVKQLKLNNQAAAAALERAAEEEKDIGKATILNKVIEQLALNQADDGERINTLEKSVKQLVNFIEKGGEVDFLVQDEAEANLEEEDAAANTREELRIIFKEVRQIERKLNLISFKE